MTWPQPFLLDWFLLGFYLLLSRECQPFEGRSQSVHTRIPGTGWGQHTAVEEDTSVWGGGPVCLAPGLSSRFSTGRSTPPTPPCNAHPGQEPLSLSDSRCTASLPSTPVFTHVHSMLPSPSHGCGKLTRTSTASQQGTAQADQNLDSQAASKRTV